MKLKIMTFNTLHCQNYLNNKIDYQSIIKLIKKYNPDIIGLNEIFGKGFDKSINSNQALYIAKNLNYYSYFGAATIINFKLYGNAILSKYPLLNTRKIRIPYPIIKKGNNLYERRNIIKSTININNKTLDIFTTHLGLNEDEQINALNKIKNILPQNNFILLGDFNLNYNHNLFKIIQEDVIDTAIKSKDKCLTYPSNNPNIKYDYIFTSKNIKTNKAYTIKEIISDHLAYIAEIEI